MRSPKEVELVDSLAEQGLNNCQIARVTGIPRATVRDWRLGRRPNFDRISQQVGPPILEEDAESAYSYLLGIYLGDGHITRLARTFRLRIFMDSQYDGIISSCERAIEAILPNRVSVLQTRARMVVISVYSGALPRLFPQHGSDVKHKRPIVLEPWQTAITRRHPQPLIRGLIHSDGCRHMNTVRGRGKSYTYPRYEFSNRSDDIRGIFCEHLDLLGIPWRPMNRWTISVARREGVAILDEFVGPKR